MSLSRVIRAISGLDSGVSRCSGLFVTQEHIRAISQGFLRFSVTVFVVSLRHHEPKQVSKSMNGVPNIPSPSAGSGSSFRSE